MAATNAKRVPPPETFFALMHRFARSKAGLASFSSDFDYQYRGRLGREPHRQRRIREVANSFKFQEFSLGRENDHYEWQIINEANDEANRIFPRLDWRAITTEIYASGLHGELFSNIPTKKTYYEVRALISKPIDRYIRGAHRSAFITAHPFFQKLFDDAFLAAAAEAVVRVADSYKREKEETPSADAKSSPSVKEIRAAGSGAPNFRPSRGRIAYFPQRADKRFFERKAIVKERIKTLLSACATRANEQAELLRLAESYAKALRTLTLDRGAYKLHLIGLDIDALLRIKAASPIDPDRNPSIDTDLMLATQSLMIAHAGLVATFPDVAELSKELDRYQAQSGPIDALQNRVLEPVLKRLADAPRLFDAKTQALTKEISEIDDVKASKPERQSRAVVSAKHGWLRGALSAIGQFILTQSKGIGKTARDELVKETVKKSVAEFATHPATLFAAAVAFVAGAGSALSSLAKALPASFGWLTHLLRWLGLL